MCRQWLTQLLILLFLVACSTVAVTGRSQLNLIPNSQMLPMSFNEYSNVISKSTLSSDEKKTKMIVAVGTRIQLAVEKYMKQKGLESELAGYQWEFKLIESNEPNAWCMPGGKVAFYTGILPICKDEAGVAVVMGHEIAHAIARHGNERMSLGLIQQAGGAVLQEALKDEPEETRGLYLSLYGIGTTVGGMLPYSRLHESEADEMGLIFMAMAGYDPKTAVDFWTRMKMMSGGTAPPEFLSTHPSNDTRIADIKKHLPKALKYYQK